MQGGRLLQDTPKQQFSTNIHDCSQVDALHMPSLRQAAGTWASHAGEEALEVTAP